jgi:HTH-type transcriptional regulator / antitoxin HigA
MTDEQIETQYHPTKLSPPGDTLADILEERSIRQNELATRMGVTPKFVNELIAGKVAITPSTALALEKSLGTSAAFWLARDARFQEARARREATELLQESVSWLDQLPLKDMRSFGWIKTAGKSVAVVEECLRYFGVASVSAWQEYCVKDIQGAAYRASDKVKAAPGAVAAWLRAGELKATEMECSPFDRDRFLAAVHEARSMTVENNPAVYLPKLKKLFAGTGVAVVEMRAPKGCPISGAVRWLSPNKALIQLSFRYLSDFLEEKGMSGEDENEANEFSRNRLIPPNRWAEFVLDIPTEYGIIQFAESIGIAPGIVVGRLQHEKRLHPGRLNHLKVRYQWTGAA